MIIIFFAGLFFIGQTIHQAQAHTSESQKFPPNPSKTIFSNEANTAEFAPPIRAPLRISIPYGFDTPLPILNGGSEVIASGHGGCTDGQQVTVAITITQAASSAVATGEKVQNCNGMLQTWSAVTTAETSYLFVNGAAEACGFATTREGEKVTDTFAWCKDVDLIALNEQTYLPIIAKQ